MKTINGKNYFYNKNSIMQTGMTAINGKRYLFDENGVMLTGMQSVCGRKYYFDENGVMQTGLVTIDGKKYYFDPDGIMRTGLQTVGGKEHYFSEDGPMEEGTWEERNGQTYYHGPDGKTYSNGVFSLMGSKYLFDENGVMQTGWQEAEGGYCLFDRESGRMLTDCIEDGIEIGKDGKAVLDEYSKGKIETMMKARKIMLEVTEPTDSMEEKRLKCFNWVLSLPYHRFRLISELSSEYGWEVVFANDIFDYQKGCCVSESAATAFLFREIGYTNVAVCNDSSHAWLFIGDKLYDPVFAEGKDFDQNYDVDPYDYRGNPLNKCFIDNGEDNTDNTEVDL